MWIQWVMLGLVFCLVTLFMVLVYSETILDDTDYSKLLLYNLRVEQARVTSRPIRTRSVRSSASKSRSSNGDSTLN